MTDKEDKTPTSLLLPQEVRVSLDKNHERVSEENATTSCGFGKYTPRWLQVFASKKTYVLIYGILGMNQTAIGAYFIGTISTIEKRFGLPSSTSGLIASSWDFGALCTVLLMSFVGSTGHKTRWVAFCALFAAVSCYFRYLPYLLFEGNTHSNYALNGSSIDLCNNSSIANENCSLNSEGLVTSIILAIAHIALGVGTSACNTLGAAYLDDNSLKDKAPFLISLTTCLRNLGPTVGFLLASYALHENKQSGTESQGKNDQQWIGAWQLGWIPLGTVHLFLASLMAFFPKTLPREAQRRKIRISVFENCAKKKWSLNDMKFKVARLIKNPVLMCNVLSSTSHMFGVIGYWIFMPKYIEAQFMQTASRANLITGTVGLICSLFGIILSGSYISKCKPHPRYLAAWSFFTKVVNSIVYIMFAFISCDKGNFNGILPSDHRFNLVSSCNMECDCSFENYSPVCALDLQTTFFSPCHAACRTDVIINGTRMFDKCSCIPGEGSVVDGPCPSSCTSHFFMFVTLLCFLQFLTSTGRAGSVIIQYRSVDPDDKSLSIALSEVMLCGLAFIPAPIIYGMVLDSSCLVWGEECGRKGNCVLYDEKMLRIYLNFTASGFLFLAALFDFGVFKSVKMLNIYDNDENDDHEKT